MSELKEIFEDLGGNLGHLKEGDWEILERFPREEWKDLNLEQLRQLQKKYTDYSFEFFKKECEKRGLDEHGVFDHCSMKTAYEDLVMDAPKHCRRFLINKIMYQFDNKSVIKFMEKGGFKDFVEYRKGIEFLLFANWGRAMIICWRKTKYGIQVWYAAHEQSLSPFNMIFQNEDDIREYIGLPRKCDGETRPQKQRKL